MKTLIIALLFLTGTCLFAQQPIELPLWINGAPNSNGQINEEQQENSGGITNSAITVYQSSKPNGMAIIMCPGGGYGGLAINHEDMALLKYKVPASLHAYPVGGHGWDFKDDFLYKRQWTEELEKWLRAGLRF